MSLQAPPQAPPTAPPKAMPIGPAHRLYTKATPWVPPIGSTQRPCSRVPPRGSTHGHVHRPRPPAPPTDPTCLVPPPPYLQVLQLSSVILQLSPLALNLCLFPTLLLWAQTRSGQPGSPAPRPPPCHPGDPAPLRTAPRTARRPQTWERLQTVSLGCDKRQSQFPHLSRENKRASIFTSGNPRGLSASCVQVLKPRPAHPAHDPGSTPGGTHSDGLKPLLLGRSVCCQDSALGDKVRSLLPSNAGVPLTLDSPTGGPPSGSLRGSA